MENGCSVSKNTIKKLCNLYKVDVESLYNPSNPAKEMTVDLLSEDILAGILQRNSLLLDLQREVVLQFTYIVGKTAVMSRDDIQAILSDAITDKKNYNLSDIITACMAVNEKTIRNITDIAVA
jgi:hypothetical protein